MIGVAYMTSIRELAALNVKASVMAIVHELFPVDGASAFFDGLLPPAWAAAVALGGYVAGGVVFLRWRIARAERLGLGGG